jgi:hypothetical protein
MNVDRRHVLQAVSTDSALAPVLWCEPASTRAGDFVSSETIVVPDHGPIGNRESALSVRHMLCAIEGRMKRLSASGSPVAGILATAPTSE